MKALPNKHNSEQCKAIEEEGRRPKSTPRESWRQQQKTEMNGDEWSVECFPLSDKALVR